MKVRLRADSADGIHTKFTVFMNGADCGQLCMTDDEAVHFHNLVMFSNYKMADDERISSGAWGEGRMGDVNASS